MASLEKRHDRPIQMHPLLQVATPLVEHINHYPSLMCLAMTCRAFWAMVHSYPTTLAKTFDNLEVCGTKLQMHDGKCYVASYLEYWRQTPRVRYTYAGDVFSYIVGDTLPDIFRYGCGGLRSFRWMPCYGCRTIRSREEDFFDHWTQCPVLLNHDFVIRRCVDCNVTRSNLSGTSPFRTALKFGKRAPYLQPMPSGIVGFLLRCSCCRTFERVSERPGPEQFTRKLCDACFVATDTDSSVSAVEEAAALSKRMKKKSLKRQYELMRAVPLRLDSAEDVLEDGDLECLFSV